MVAGHHFSAETRASRGTSALFVPFQNGPIQDQCVERSQAFLREADYVWLHPFAGKQVLVHHYLADGHA
jgi:hypothetical protein